MYNLFEYFIGTWMHTTLCLTHTCQASTSDIIATNNLYVHKIQNMCSTGIRVGSTEFAIFHSLTRIEPVTLYSCLIIGSSSIDISTNLLFLYFDQLLTRSLSCVGLCCLHLCCVLLCSTLSYKAIKKLTYYAILTLLYTCQI